MDKSVIHIYQIAFGTMGPILNVRIVKTLCFHKMTISPRDALV